MRVTVVISCWETAFDFDDPMEGYNFAKTLIEHHNKDAGDGKYVEVRMGFIPDGIEQIGNDDDE